MKHFLGFLAFIFASLFLSFFLRKHQESAREARPVVRIFATSSSFNSADGPGKALKEIFEKSCDCWVEYSSGNDALALAQKLKPESHNSADLVVSLDQFDLEHLAGTAEWKTHDTSPYEFEPTIKSGMLFSQFVPYDWGVLAFNFHKTDTSDLPHKLDDLLDPKWRGQIVVQEPRTSSPGFQFLRWLIQLRGEEAAFEFLKTFSSQVKMYAPSWSVANGLFTTGHAKTFFSYATSPIANPKIVAAPFEDGHPAQIEYVGVPAICKNCDLAHGFIKLMLSKEGQKILMEKNYMFPVIKGVKDGTPFADIPAMKVLPISGLSIAERERILKKWSTLRRID